MRKLFNDKTYGYNDVTIVPAKISHVCSRSQCQDHYHVNNLLPIFTAPMAAVVSEKNYRTFINNRICPIIPRNVDLELRLGFIRNGLWVAISLSELKSLFIEEGSPLYDNNAGTYNICVDVANGHMVCLYDMIYRAKMTAETFNCELTVMTGNIANPDTYTYICERNSESYKHNRFILVDYIRLGIGGGQGCITTSNVGVHFGQASLIKCCAKLKDLTESHLTPKIIADGGIRNYDDVIKALALGADYVMIGGLFSRTLESAGEKLINGTNSEKKKRFDRANYSDLFYDHETEQWYEVGNDEPIGQILVKFYGMASADGQIAINGTKSKTSEGVTKELSVIYQLDKWVENMSAYLRSAMSYCDCTFLSDFIGKQKIALNSIQEISAVNK